MEPYPKTETTTGTISADLDRLEILVGRIGLNSREQARDLLALFDSIDERIQAMDENETRLRIQVHFDSLLTRLRKEAGRYLKDFGGAKYYQAQRGADMPAERVWWHLDQYLVDRRKASMRRTFITLGILAGVLAVLGLVYRAFLAPDPIVVAQYSHEQYARDALRAGDFETALSEANQGLAYGQDNATLLILKGVAEEMLGRPEDASSSFARAEQVEGSRENFLLQRAEIYTGLALYGPAQDDVTEAIKANPNSAGAWMYQAAVYEGTQRKQEALAAYNKAFELAQQGGDTALAAMARTRYAMLMQTVGDSMPLEQTPGP